MGGSKDNERKETAAEIAASQVAVKEWNLYNSELKQFEDSFIQRVNNFNTDSNMADVKQAADLSYNREYGKARDATATQLAASGVDPSSSKFKAKLSDLASMGQKAEGLAGLEDTARLSAQKASNDAYNDFNRRSSNAQAAGTLAGIGASMYMNQPKATPNTSFVSSNTKSVQGHAGLDKDWVLNRG